MIAGLLRYLCSFSLRLPLKNAYAQLFYNYLTWQATTFVNKDQFTHKSIKL